MKRVFPAAMFTGVFLILCGLGMPWWLAILALCLTAFVAYAEHNSHRGGDGR